MESAFLSLKRNELVSKYSSDGYSIDQIPQNADFYLHYL